MESRGLLGHENPIFPGEAALPVKGPQIENAKLHRAYIVHR